MQITHNSAAPWHALVLEAEQRLGAHLHEDMESYLVFMLMRYLRDAKMTKNVLALAFLDGLSKTGALRKEALRGVGDQCLLFAGFFPEQARRRCVSMDYFVHIGRNAYDQLAGNPLFHALARHFVLLADVLTQIRSLNAQAAVGNLLDLHEIWEQTGSRHAALQLQARGIQPLPMPSARKH